jgi:hypothetical protein
MKGRGTRRYLRGSGALALGLLAVAAAAAACAKNDGATPAGGGGAPPTSASAAMEDVNAAIGQPAEVADLTATVTEVTRKRSVSAGSEAGYVVAQVSVANNSARDQRYTRLQFQLRKPDGTSINRTPVAGVVQLGEGTLPPGETVSGQLIFTVGDASGAFAITFTPRQDGQPEQKRGVWAFPSTPGDAS